MSERDYNQWSSVRPFVGSQIGSNWIPKEDRDRVSAYQKYDEMYWNDPRQYALRVLEDEEPLYIPNARIIIDTTAHYLLKGLELTCTSKPTMERLSAFLKREAFYSRFTTAKLAGVARGDFVFHMTANPSKANHTRISLNAVDPRSVFPIWDEDEPGKMIGCTIAVQYTTKADPDKDRVRMLKYLLEEAEDGTKRVTREEAIYELDPSWWGDKAKKVKQIIKKGYLDKRITTIPIYWFPNRQWDGEDFGSSELRGIEAITQVISQGSTDVSASLSLEGLGVYATDGGRPVNQDGDETDWEVAPGKVMEVPSGSYFRRVEGVGSITPATDQIKYLENKVNEAAGLSDVALGKVDAQIAQSGIALAIRFSPTLSKIESRDQLGIDILTQLFFDWKTWYEVFERETLEGDIIPVIGDKLPTDRVAKVNELNNMMDRKVISASYYRKEMEKLGYKFPSDSVMEKQIEEDIARVTPVVAEPAEDETPPEDSGSGNDTTADGDTLENQSSSNNRNRPNESSGTEAPKQTRDA